MATHSSVLAWRIPWTEEPGGLQSMRSQRVRAKLLMGQKGKETDCLRWHKRFSSNQTFFFFQLFAMLLCALRGLPHLILIPPLKHRKVQ